MRPSSRTSILQAALRVAEVHGVKGLTLDAAAAEAGVSKGGLIYHFSSKRDLLLGVAQYVTDSWETELLRNLPSDFASSTPAERLKAYVLTASTRAGVAGELALLTDAIHDESLLAPWQDLIRRWVEPANPIDRVIVRLAAEGLWFAEATHTASLEPPMRRAVIDRLLKLTDDAPES